MEKKCDKVQLFLAFDLYPARMTSYQEQSVPPRHRLRPNRVKTGVVVKALEYWKITRDSWRSLEILKDPRDP